MKRLILGGILIAELLGLAACSRTRAVNILSETRANVGQQMSCFYHRDNLYCGSPLITPDRIDKLHVMDQVVYGIYSEEQHRPEIESGGESGTYSTRFSRKPPEYSLWNCVKTGNAEPAVRCKLVRESDPYNVAAQEALISFDNSVVRPLTEKKLLSACGKPRKTKQDRISRTLIYSSSQRGLLVEVQFDTYLHPGSLDSLKSIDEKTGQFRKEGFIWVRHTDPGYTDAAIQKYLPCLR